MHSVKCQVILTLSKLSGNRRVSAHILIMSQDKLFCISLSNIVRNPVNKIQQTAFNLIITMHSNQKCSIMKEMTLSWKWIEKHTSFELSILPPFRSSKDKYHKQLYEVQIPFSNFVNPIQLLPLHCLKQINRQTKTFIYQHSSYLAVYTTILSLYYTLNTTNLIHVTYQ